MAPSADSSSEDDEFDYCNVAARLRVLSKQTRNKPRPPPPRVSPKRVEKIIEPNSPVLEGTADYDPVQNGSVKSATSEDPCEDSDDAESIADSSSSFPDGNVIEVSSVDTGPRTPLDTVEIFDSPPRGTANESNLDELEDSIIDDTTVGVHIRWKSNKVERIYLSKHEPLLKIFQKFADQENIPVNRILVMRGDVPVKRNDTPASLKLSIIDVLEGGIISAETSNHESEEEDDEEDMCKIKAQISAKKFVTFKLRRDEPFKKLKEHCAKEWDVPMEKIKFSFDGDDVSAADTPDILDLDDEACIDAKILP